MNASASADESFAKHDDDASLVQATLQGRRECFERLVERHHRRILGLSTLRLRDPHAAEDVTQETFLRAWRNLAACREPARFAAWLAGIARNCANEWLRKRQRVIPMSDPTEEIAAERTRESVCPSAAEEEAVAALEKRLARLEYAMDGLSPETRRILAMKYRDGKTCAEIARLLNKKTNTIAQTLSRAYEQIEEAILGQERKEGMAP